LLQSLLPNIPAGTPHWWYYLCVGAAVLITAISKAGFGGGVGILAIPVMALAVGPKEMLGITLPLLILCDIFSNLHHLGHYDFKRLKYLVPGLLLGVVVGTVILHFLSGRPPAEFNQIMNGVVGIICFAVVALQMYRLTGREAPTLPSHPGSAVAVGTVAGTVSTLNNGAGPIVQIYLLQEKLEKRILVGTMLLYFLIGNIAKVPTYVKYDLITLQTLHDSIWFLPLIPLGTMLGAWMHHRVAEKPFAIIMYVAAGLAAVQLIIRASHTLAIWCGAALLVFALYILVVYLRRPKAGACRSCGYDLRGNSASAAVCPECGEPVMSN